MNENRYQLLKMTENVENAIEMIYISGRTKHLSERFWELRPEASIRKKQGVIMKATAFFATILAANMVLAASATITLPSESSQIKLTDAQYREIPTKVKVVENDGFCPDSQYPCTETIVLARKPVVTAYVEYTEGFGMGDGNEKRYASVDFDPAAFSAADVAELKSASGPFQKPFSSIRKDFAKKNLSMSVKSAKKTIQVVDMSKSELCHINDESGLPLNPSCEDKLVYKNAVTTVKEITIKTK